MAVTKADKVVELQSLESAFQGAQTAVLVDYKGLNVPQVTELRRQLRATKATYKVIKNTLAKRAVKGTAVRGAERASGGDDGRRLYRVRSGRARQDADRIHQDGAAAEDQGGGGAGAHGQAGRGQRAGRAAGSSGAAGEAALRHAGADGPDCQRAERCATRPDERAGAGWRKSDRNRNHRNSPGRERRRAQSEAGEIQLWPK